jgi:hypothetical protein
MAEFSTIEGFVIAVEECSVEHGYLDLKGEGICRE